MKYPERLAAAACAAVIGLVWWSAGLQAAVEVAGWSGGITAGVMAGWLLADRLLFTRPCRPEHAGNDQPAEAGHCPACSRQPADPWPAETGWPADLFPPAPAGLSGTGRLTVSPEE